MRGDLLALGAIGALAIAGAARGGSRSVDAVHETREQISATLLQDARFKVEGWQKWEGAEGPLKLYVRWSRHTKVPYDAGMTLAEEVAKALAPLGPTNFEDPDIYTNLARIKLRAGPALLWIWAAIRREQEDAAVFLVMQNDKPLLLLGGDYSSWGEAQKTGALWLKLGKGAANHKDIPQALRQVTQDILKSMQTDVSWTRLAQESGADPAQPCAWDVNCGWCEEWAEAASRKLDVVGSHYENVVWLDQISAKYEDMPHAVLKLHGRYYDAQHPEGVDHVKKLSLVKGVSREAWLKREARGKRAW
jgi:hypothetical protein